MHKTAHIKAKANTDTLSQFKRREGGNHIAMFFSWIKDMFKEQELLLASLLCLLFVPAFLINQFVKNVAIYFFLVMVVAASLWELRTQRKGLIFGIIMSLTTVLLNSFDFSEKKDLLFLFRMTSLMAFFVMLIVHTMNRLTKMRRITIHIIYGVVNGYLLIGMIGGMGFRLINHFYSNSFMLTNGLQPKIDDFTYFSFITLSTLGYGDITPISPPAQALAILLSVVGPMYTAIVIGIIIGKFTVR